MSKARASFQLSLKLLLKNDRGEVLILKALEHGSFAGHYDLPGGRVDADEVAENLGQIIEREVAEEIGSVEFTLNQKPAAIGRHRIPAGLTSEGRDLDVLYLFFEATYRGGEITISPEHTDYKWVRLDKVDLEAHFTSGILEGVRMYIGAK